MRGDHWGRRRIRSSHRDHRVHRVRRGSRQRSITHITAITFITRIKESDLHGGARGSLGGRRSGAHTEITERAQSSRATRKRLITDITHITHHGDRKSQIHAYARVSERYALSSSPSPVSPVGPVEILVRDRCRVSPTYQLLFTLLALGSELGGGARSTLAGGPRISVRIGFKASAQI